MFVVAGKLKGRKLFVPLHLKVTEARIKQAIFNIVPEIFKNKIVLDLFAGSGALGIESISGGAREAIFVDKSPHCIKVVEKNIKALGLEERSEVYCKDAFLFLKKGAQEKRKVDIVFLDPPYRQRLTTKSLKEILKCDILTPSSLVIGLSFFREDIREEGYSCLFERRYGDRMIRIFRPRQKK